MVSSNAFGSDGRATWLVAALLLGLLSCPASAQMALPGAVAPDQAGAPQPAPTRPKPRPVAARPAPPRMVSPSSLAGRTLLLNGGPSQIVFEAKDKSIDVAHLTLAGERISNSRETCKVEAPATPIAVSEVAHPDGVARIQIGFPACPIAFDVLDGAALVDPAQGRCEFKESNCRVNPVGLWGPSSGDLGADKLKGIERARAAAEGAVRATYKDLVATTKDRPTIMAFAHEQAQFSSTREEICRDYAGEGRHGFCAAKLTEARASMLKAMLVTASAAKAERIAKKAAARPAAKPTRPRPVRRAAPAPVAPPEAGAPPAQ